MSRLVYSKVEKTKDAEIFDEAELDRAFSKGLSRFMFRSWNEDVEKEMFAQIKSNVFEFLQGDKLSAYLSHIGLSQESRLVEAWSKLDGKNIKVGLVFRAYNVLYLLDEQGAIIAQLRTKATKSDWSEKDQEKLKAVWLADSQTVDKGE